MIPLKEDKSVWKIRARLGSYFPLVVKRKFLLSTLASFLLLVGPCLPVEDASMKLFAVKDVIWIFIID